MVDARHTGRGRSFVHTLAALVVLCLLLAAGATRPARAADPAPASAALEARVMAITAELRCLVCQNQTIADSHAALAVDLRQQVREMLQRGDTDAQILSYMTDRYGDFVLYRPPVKSTTWLLWWGPALLLIGGLITLVVVLRRRSRLPASAFEPDPSPDADDPASPR